MSKMLNEWSIKAPWGKIALASWGKPSGIPVLLVHGLQDSKPTLMKIVDLLQDDFYYVAMNMPGNGNSDAFPAGAQIMWFHYAGAIGIVVQHLKWDRFMYIGVSTGSEQGLYYNAIYPGRIQKFIHLNAMNNVCLQSKYYQDMFQTPIPDYYCRGKMFNKDGVVTSYMKSRGVTREEAEAVLSSYLSKMGKDQYSLPPYPEDLSKNAPPSLHIAAIGERNKTGKQAANQLIKSNLDPNAGHVIYIKMGASEEVPVSYPEGFSHVVRTFLKKDFEPKSKM